MRFFDIPQYKGPGIYAIWNQNNGKCYIGSSININDRLQTHNYSFCGLWCNQRIREDIRKGHSFRSEILEKLPFDIDERSLRIREKEYLDTFSAEQLYNYRTTPVPSHRIKRPTSAASINKYIAKVYDRINLTVPKGKKETIQTHAEAQGESVNGFINRAIDEAIDRDKRTQAASEGPEDGTEGGGQE